MSVNIYHILYSFMFLYSVSVNSDGYNKDVPHWLSVSPLDEGGVYVVWTPVIPGENESISGYKILMWTIKEKQEHRFQLINGNQIPGLVKEDFTEEPFNVSVISESTPRIITIENLDANSATIDNVKDNVLYEIRIMAYGEKDGPSSEPWRFKYMQEEKFKHLIQRNEDTCTLTIASKGPEGDDQIHNFYF